MKRQILDAQGRLAHEVEDGKPESLPPVRSSEVVSLAEQRQGKRQLNGGDKHLMGLIQKGADHQGWAKVSKVVWPHIAALPPQLVKVMQTDDGGIAKLTYEGEVVLEWS